MVIPHRLHQHSLKLHLGSYRFTSFMLNNGDMIIGRSDICVINFTFDALWTCILVTVHSIGGDAYCVKL